MPAAEIDTTTDLEPLCKLEDIIVRWLKTQSISFVSDGNTRQRIYRGFENEEVAQNAEDKSVPWPEGDTGQSTEPSEGAESSVVRVPCIIVNADTADCIGPDFCGNYEVSVTVEVCSDSSDSSHRDHRARVNEVMQLLLTDEIRDELMAFDDDFDCSKIVFRRVSKRVYGTDTFVHGIELLFQHFTPKRID